MSSASRQVSEVQLSSPAQHIQTSESYHLVHHSGEITLYDSVTRAKLCHVDVGKKVSHY